MKRLYSIVFFSALICGLLLNGCNSENEAQHKNSECDIIEFTDEVNSVNWETKGTNITVVYQVESKQLVVK